MKRISLAAALAVIAITTGLAEQRPGSPADRPSDTPAPTRQVVVLANQRYSSAEGKAGLCDIYSPATEPPSGGHPVVMVIHGGGWISGDKWTLEGYSRLLARNGFVAITINYRLAPQYKFPAQVDDVRQALLWAVENAGKLSIDIQRLGLFGYSAGGHLSTLVAALADEPLSVRAAASAWPIHDARWKKLPTIRAVCAGGPPCDFRTLPLDNTALAYFLGGSRRELPDVYEVASPTAHVSAADPVTQLIHGEKDLLVPIQSSLRLHQAQKTAGVDSRMETIPDQGHMVTFLNPKTRNKMLEFFQEVLVKTPPRPSRQPPISQVQAPDSASAGTSRPASSGTSRPATSGTSRPATAPR
ncbi:MAG: alpha/beta hydrolase [Pirellulales bacterium]|nr:alpha/beta hydrolase [Pirellulales bacterium]